MSQSEKEPKPGLLLNTHRKTVESTKGMSPAVLLGSSFAFAMGLFAWGGMKVDEKYGSEPWGVLGGVTLGFLYGGYEVWKVTRISSPAPSTSVEGEEESSYRPDKG